MPLTPHAPHDFLPTRWTLVLAAKLTDTRAARALEDLARAYWYPLYAYARRQGLSAQDAEDLIQNFFAALIERRALSAVDRAKGRFRSFLLASLKHFMANEFDKARAQKRGGGVHTFSLSPQESEDAESRYRYEPADEITPEKLFERRWALAVLEGVLAQLEADYAKRNEAALFTALKPLITGGEPQHSHAALAQTLHSTEGAIKTAAHRLRRRYRDLLRAHIAQTVDTPEEIDAEITYLRNCL